MLKTNLLIWKITHGYLRSFFKTYYTILGKNIVIETSKNAASVFLRFINLLVNVSFFLFFLKLSP